MSVLSTRDIIEYTDEEKDDNTDSVQEFVTGMRRLRRKGKSISFDNQRKIGKDITLHLLNREIINVMVVAETQSGKTGSIIEAIMEYCKKTPHSISIDNIYIITGLSSREWKEQTKDRVPELMQKRVFHRNDLDTDSFIQEVKSKKNILMFIDEIQIAVKHNQTIYKSFEKIGFLDINYLLKNDIKIVEVSATPDGSLYELKEWKNHSALIIAENGEGYCSSYDLYLSGRVFQYKKLYHNDIFNLYKKIYKIENNDEKNIKLAEEIDKIVNSFIAENINCDLSMNILISKCLEYLECYITNNNDLTNFIRHYFPKIYEIYKNINEIKKIILDKLNNNNYYHIIRTENGLKQKITIKYFNYLFTDMDKNFITYDIDNKKNINDILEKKPIKQTFIFIKELLRCAKTLIKTHNGVQYDRCPSKPDDSVSLQSLIGRDCGYDNNGVSIHFTNIDSIIKYKQLIDSKFDNPEIKWNSQTTVFKDGNLQGSNTINSKENYYHDDTSSEASYEPLDYEPIINKFNNYDDAKKYLLDNNIAKIGPTKKIYEINKDGFYLAKINGEDIVVNNKNVDKIKKTQLKTGGEWKLYPFYENDKDKNSFKWITIHCPKNNTTNQERGESSSGLSAQERDVIYQ